MKSLSSAIQKRRQSGAPPPEQEQPGQMITQEGAPQESGGVEEILKSLSPEQKAELFGLLQQELKQSEGQSPEGSEQAGAEGMVDSAGSLKSTPGEQAALNEDVAKDIMGNGQIRMNEDGAPLGLSDRVKLNIKKMMGNKKG